MAQFIEDHFLVWGSDQVPYGPVELATLVEWVQNGSVTAESWVFAGKTGSWLRAAKLPELKGLFGSSGDTTRLFSPAQIDPQMLRRINILTGFSDAQLETIARLVELERAPQGARVVSRGQPGDALYLILEGELRVCLQVQDREVTINTLGAGDFFGEIALLNHGPRSADVVANTNCLLARLSGAALSAISNKAVEVAMPFFRALDRALTERIRADNRRLAEILRTPA